MAEQGKAGVLRCSADLNGPSIRGFENYIEFGYFEAETGWNCDSLGKENPTDGTSEMDAECLSQGFSVDASGAVGLRELNIVLGVGDPFGGELRNHKKILKRQILAIRKQFDLNVGKAFKIVYTVKN